MKRDGDLGREEELPPLGGFAAGLLAAERRSPRPGAGVRRSVWRRTRATLVASGLLAPLLMSKVSAAAAALGATVAGKVVALALAGVATGGAVLGTVMVAQRWRAVETPAVVPVERPVPVVAAPVAVAVAAAAPVAAPVVDREKPPERGSLTRERALIDAARAALGARDHAGARRALARHAREFPSGVFVEERAALAILLLAHTGAVDRARTAAAVFIVRYPDSVYRTRIAAAVADR